MTNRESYGVNAPHDSVSGCSGRDVLGLPISHEYREMTTKVLSASPSISALWLAELVTPVYKH